MRKVNPQNILKSKIGSGGIPAHLIERAEQIIAEGDVGFEDYVIEQLGVLTTFMELVSSKTELTEDEHYNLVLPVMTLKAHGSMFGYKLISDISMEVLHLIEHIDSFNSDVLEILNVYHNTTKVIIDKGLKADGGSIGKTLVKELNAACERYFAKYVD